MHIPPLIVPLIAGVAVYIDASTIGIEKGQIRGFFNMGAGMWAVACFLFLIIALPAYLFKRNAYIEVIAQLKAQAVLQQQQAQDSATVDGVWPPPPQTPPKENKN